jgi:pyridoxine/pyridoxamine 5'-phosphate oxidase
MVTRLSEEESTEYFHCRPRGSQLSAMASDQSRPVACRQVLQDKLSVLQSTHHDDTQPLPKPSYWGGYLLTPVYFEFWQGNIDRLHDRIVFRRPLPDEKLDLDLTNEGVNGWVYERLNP